jgi:choice-of-anchor B domain-containing protein
MKSYRRYVYATSECTGTNEGVMVFNMTNLPASFSYVGSVPSIPSWYYASHNLSIDTMKGYMYVEALESAGLTISIYNLANQANPTFVGSMGINVGDNGAHDVFAWNDTLFVAEGWNHSFSIWNMANKANPQLIARVPIPAGGYVHNIWPSPDLKYCATTEETAGKTIKIWDLHNLGNIQLISEYLAPNGLAHNTHWKGDKLYTSHYESGITVTDVSDPFNPQEIYRYDTWGTENSDFNGCWGAYPFTGNGFVYASNMDGKMYVFSEHLDILSDSMWAETTFVSAGTQAIVDIYAKNSLPLRQFTIPLDWNGPYGMTLLSTSRTGTRTDYFQSESFLGIDMANNRVAIALKTSTNGTAPDLAPGTGKILSVTFDVPGGASGLINPVKFTPYQFGGGSHNPSFVTDCIAYEPDTIPGGVKLNSGSCCIGSRGNVNGSASENPTIADLTYLVQFLFNGGGAPPCLDEANVNSVSTITVADLTFLVQFLFNSGPAPAACP